MSKRRLPGRFPWSAQVSRIGQRFLLPRRPNSKRRIALLAAASLAVAFSLAEAGGRINLRTHINSPKTIRDNNLIHDYDKRPNRLAGSVSLEERRPKLVNTLTGYPLGLQERRHELVTVRPLKPSVEPEPILREEISRTLDSVSPDLGQRLRNDWTTDLSSKYTGQIVGRSVARFNLVASHIDVSDVTVYYKFDRVRFPVSESDPFIYSARDISVHKDWYRALAIGYVSQGLMEMENHSYSDVPVFVSDLGSNLQQPGTRDRPDFVTSLDQDLAATAHYVDFRFDPGGEKLAISASRDENDLIGVKFYEAEVHLTLPEMAREVIDKHNGSVVGNY